VSIHETDLDLPELRGSDFWNGVEHSYIPPAELRIDPRLKLHETGAEEIDPVTYEVVRHSLLNINLEHNAMIEKLGASQVVISGRDYQTTIMTQCGEMVFVGPGVQYFANSASLSVQFTLEHRSVNPGINTGDMYLANDVYVGAPHQPDTCIAAPVFIDGELFCWVSNTLHYQDVGGSVSGSFCVDANDAWDEGLNWPPIKLVEGSELRTDVERLFVRQSRFPVLVGMDLRAAIASNEYARKKIVELVDRYGADVVKGVMYRVLDAGEQLFAERLESIPDGTWSARSYAEAATPGDRNVYTYQVNVSKLDGRIIVDNLGTDPQAGSINITFAACAGGTLAAIMGAIVPDLAGAYGGPYRRVEFRLEPGLLTCADFPAACSPSGAATTETQINNTAIAVTKMLSCGDAAARGLIVGSTMPHVALLNYGGINAAGDPFLAIGSEVMLASFGASASRDGYDFGGHWWIPNGVGANVEDMEARHPALYLYRRALSAAMPGSGRHRSGVGFVSAVTLRDEAMGHAVWTMNEAWPRGQGIWGAPPPGRSRQRVRYGTDLQDRLAAGDVPLSVDELTGETYAPRWWEMNVPFGEGDVFEWVFPCMAGYGDPLLRDPPAVHADVRNRMLDEVTAERVFGVILRDDAVDEEATEAGRLALRRERLAGTEPQPLVEPPTAAQRVGEMLSVVDGRWWCNGADLGGVEDNYKDRARVIERRTYDIGPEYATDDPEMADGAIYREYICPVTGYIIDTETSLRDQAPLHDVKLYSAGGQQHG
jgi:N-methylhydantoinase B